MAVEMAAGPPWRRLTDEERREWATAMVPNVVVDRTNEAITLNGPCPACGHDFSVVLTESAILSELEGGHKGIGRPDRGECVDWAGTIDFLATCHCEGDHEGRPSLIRHGCGASGWLVDEPEA